LGSVLTRIGGIALALSLAATLAACSTEAERELARMNSATTVALNEMAACAARAEASDAFRQLKARLPPVDGSLPSATLLADRSRPTTPEAALLVELHTTYTAPCRKLTVERLAAINPAFAEVAAKSFAESDAAFARLVRREESWGDYAAGSIARRQAFALAFAEAGERVNRGLVQSHVDELQQRALP
jgi:hypothetical protein